MWLLPSISSLEIAISGWDASHSEERQLQCGFLTLPNRVQGTVNTQQACRINLVTQTQLKRKGISLSLRSHGKIRTGSDNLTLSTVLSTDRRLKPSEQVLSHAANRETQTHEALSRVSCETIHSHSGKMLLYNYVTSFWAASNSLRSLISWHRHLLRRKLQACNAMPGCTPSNDVWRSEGNLYESLLFPGTELRSLASVATVFTCWPWGVKFFSFWPPSFLLDGTW